MASFSKEADTPRRKRRGTAFGERLTGASEVVRGAKKTRIVAATLRAVNGGLLAACAWKMNEISDKSINLR
jgi:hypothetical protein